METRARHALWGQRVKALCGRDDGARWSEAWEGAYAQTQSIDAASTHAWGVVRGLETRADVYGSDKPSPLDNPSKPSGEPVPGDKPYDGGIPAYLKPINVNTRDIQAQMRGHLNASEPKVQRWLYSTWNANRDAIKYQELRNAVRDGQMPASWIVQWQQDYAAMVNDQLAPQWKATMRTASGRLLSQAYEADEDFTSWEPIDIGRHRVRQWIDERGGELIVSISKGQEQAVRSILERYTLDEPVSADELGRLIRPVVGLTPRQAEAVDRRRRQLVAEGLAKSVVDHRVGNYAAYLHRVRAKRIARTELAFAWNHGMLSTVRQAVDDGLLSRPVVKRLMVADDERTCSHCNPLDGATIGLEQTFPGSTLRLPNIYVPPLHPSCRCWIQYQVLEDTRGVDA